MAYTVFIDDNFHHGNASERVTHGQFETSDEAVGACRSIVDDFLAGAFEPCVSATALYGLYTCFGDDPFHCSSRVERRIGGLLSVAICAGAVRSVGRPWLNHF